MSNQSVKDVNVQDLVAVSDTGARNPHGFSGRLLIFIALAWSLFQLYYASPLPFMMYDIIGVNGAINFQQARSIHLGFAILMAFLAYPSYVHNSPHFKRLASIVFFGAGSYLIFNQLSAQSHYYELALNNSFITEKYSPSSIMLGFWLGIAGFIGLILGNPIIQRKLFGKEESSLSLSLFFISIGLLAIWLYKFHELSSLLIHTEIVGKKVVQKFLASGAAGAVLLTASIPGFETPDRSRISLPDWFIALLATFCALYTFLFSDDINLRLGALNSFDIVVSVLGILLLLEATRRTLGPALMLVALAFLAYSFFADFLPDILLDKGKSLNKIANHQWLTTEGVFGTAIGVSTKFVFLFVLFGALLEKAGAGNYFIKIAFALLGHLRGGPAKAAVAASGMTGLISGSSIANVVTTGTFTIPLMKKVGFSAEKAGAIEVASSVNGQIMPPVMGAAALLIADYAGIPFSEVIKHAFLPAIISYISLLYIVHLEALKTGMKGIDKPQTSPLWMSMIRFGISTTSLIILAGAIYFGFGWLKNPHILGDYALYFILSLVFIAYLLLLKLATYYPELTVDDPNAEMKLPELKPTLRAGLYYFLPMGLLLWCLIVEKLSPGLSAFWATIFMIFIVLTQKPLLSFFRKTHDYKVSIASGFNDFYEGLLAGARNMVGIGVATATAGIIVGTVTLMAVSGKMIALVEFVSGGYFILMLLFTAVMCLVLGMGLPTTANYAVVASIMAPVIVELGAQNGFVIPLVAVHMFVFYFGIMADVTPPVGLASFAAAAVSKADPMKTGFTAFFYSMRTIALPFVFIFNSQLLLIGITGPVDLVLTITSATIAILVFAAATQGYFFARSRWYESVILLLVAFTLFRPGYWMDMVYEPFSDRSASEIFETVEQMPNNGKIRMIIEGQSFNKVIQKTIELPLGLQEIDGKTVSGEERLLNVGLPIQMFGEEVTAGFVLIGTEANKAGLEFGSKIISLKIENSRPAKEWFFIPALLLLFSIMGIQSMRQRKQEE